MTDKKRLDTYLVEKGYFDSREKAKKVIMTGVVFKNEQRVDKPGSIIGPDDVIHIKGDSLGYVSRGGLKLEKALKKFEIPIEGKAALDCGASTGGFTDCLLQSGARKVYAVDVGYGQLDWKIRQDERVVVMERTNARYITPEQIGEPCQVATIDVSFISLRLILPPVKDCLDNEGEIIALVKPQFEAGRDKVGKKGVVRSADIHKEVLTNILLFALEEELYVKGVTYSPVKGPEGNIEFLAYLTKEKNDNHWTEIERMITSAVTEAHDEL